MANTADCPAARLHRWARPTTLVIAALGAWIQSIPVMLLGLTGLVVLAVHLVRLKESRSFKLQSEQEMVAAQTHLEQAMMLALGICGTMLTLHLLWLHQLNLALMLVVTAAITKTVWNVIYLGRPGLGSSLITLTLTVSLLWTLTL
ncbi:hypothetical protein [Ferrimonas balearica]|uniref:hypothetical protein n=1 Tax=Ferrimonas balearica TaxID=44012 RepID=UPI001C943349|nr:hypothetical protein [Ferrimonas balearica]MBY5981900.1 hypothetical protein [Ferrimonas balearica]